MGSPGNILSAESTLWNRCVRDLQAEIPEQQFNTWIRPLQAVEDGDGVDAVGDVLDRSVLEKTPIREARAVIIAIPANDNETQDDLDVDGSRLALLGFMRLFDKPKGTFAIVTPE